MVFFCCLRCWCPDRTIQQARNYIKASLGAKYVEQTMLDFDELIVESDSRTPILCLLSVGSDPSDNILVLAKRKDKGQ
jgi:dynein heavy chain